MNFIAKKLAVVTLACGILCCGAPAAEAAGGFGGGPMMGGCPAFNGGYGYQLTPEQMDTARQIFKNNFSSMDETRQALAAKRNELNSLLASPNPDGAKIESLSREIGELRGKMLAARADVRSQLAKNGLPTDFYGPEDEGPDNSYMGPRRGFHGGPRYHGHGHHGNRGCGCW